MSDHSSEWMKSICEGNISIGTLLIGYNGSKVRKWIIFKAQPKKTLKACTRDTEHNCSC